MVDKNNMYLYHYYEEKRSPFLSLSDLSDEEAIQIQDSLKAGDNIFVKRDSDGKYMFYQGMVGYKINHGLMIRRTGSLVT